MAGFSNGESRQLVCGLDEVEEPKGCPKPGMPTRQCLAANEWFADTEHSCTQPGDANPAIHGLRAEQVSANS